jgi:hypothetical protein
MGLLADPRGMISARSSVTDKLYQGLYPPLQTVVDSSRPGFVALFPEGGE